MRMLFPGKYWAGYWRLIKTSASLAALGALAWVALVSLGLYQGYAELVLAMVIFAPVGMVFLLNGLGIFYAVALRLQAAFAGREGAVSPRLIGSVIFIGCVFFLSGTFFTGLAVKAVVAILAR
jgi:hypothetical protein